MRRLTIVLALVSGCGQSPRRDLVDGGVTTDGVVGAAEDGLLLVRPSLTAVSPPLGRTTGNIPIVIFVRYFQTCSGTTTVTAGNSPVAGAHWIAGDQISGTLPPNPTTYHPGPFYRGVSVFLGNGDGTFQREASYPTLDSGAHTIVAADFDGDGAADLAITTNHEVTPMVDFGSIASGTVERLINRGDGTFQSAVAYPMAGGG